MIKFPCRCGYPFTVEDDMAGSHLQCPRCGLLNDVPTHQELQNMSPDGTILLDVAPAKAEPGRFEELRRAFAKEKVDAEGNDIDLRQTADDFARIGDDPFTIAAEKPNRIAPKYDPVTGELIREIPVEHDGDHVDPASIPMARATLNYATAKTRPPRPGFSIIVMFKPINLATMLFVFLAHMFVLMVVFGLALGLLFIIPLWFGLLMALFAHYANVVEDVGPDQNDELPRFMRHFSFVDDIWLPFVKSMLAVMYCFTAPIVANIFLPATLPGPARATCVLALVAVGVFLFPAVYLTSTTSGTVLNLRPDRVLSVIGKIGARYIVLIVMLVVGSVLYGAGIYMTSAGVFNFVASWFSKVITFPGGLFAGFGLLIAGIYLVHCFAWDLGMVYRAQHDQFPWVFQFHTPVHRTKAGALLGPKTPGRRRGAKLAKPVAAPGGGRFPK
jgi:hypothetical protein